ncbi:aldo/keto reductase [Actinophytocola sp. KF-1]
MIADRVVLGTWGLAGSYTVDGAPNGYAQLPAEQVDAVLDAAWAAGLRWVDVAPGYGAGAGMRALADWQRRRGRTWHAVVKPGRAVGAEGPRSDVTIAGVAEELLVIEAVLPDAAGVLVKDPPEAAFTDGSLPSLLRWLAHRAGTGSIGGTAFGPILGSTGGPASTPTASIASVSGAAANSGPGPTCTTAPGSTPNPTRDTTTLNSPTSTGHANPRPAHSPAPGSDSLPIGDSADIGGAAANSGPGPTCTTAPDSTPKPTRDTTTLNSATSTGHANPRPAHSPAPGSDSRPIGDSADIGGAAANSGSDPAHTTAPGSTPNPTRDTTTPNSPTSTSTSRAHPRPTSDRAPAPVVGIATHRLDLAARLGEPPVAGAVVQLEYHLLNRHVAVPVAAALAARGWRVWAMQPLAYGFLGGRYDAATRFPADDWRSRIPPRVRAAFAASAALLPVWLPPALRGRPLAEVALAWCLADENVARVVAGPRRVAHVGSVVRAVALAPALADRVRDIA